MRTEETQRTKQRTYISHLDEHGARVAMAGVEEQKRGEGGSKSRIAGLYYPA